MIGVGAIGHQVCRGLAAMGAGTLRLIDHDNVDDSNRATQGWLAVDVGQKKVHVMLKEIGQIDPTVAVSTAPTKWNPGMGFGDIVFVCVDSIKVRQEIWDFYKVFRDENGWNKSLWLDGRMRGEAVRVLSVADGLNASQYDVSLFPEEEAYQGGDQASCVQPGALYCAWAPATWMLTNLTMWLRGMQPHGDIMSNLIGGDASPRPWPV